MESFPHLCNNICMIELHNVSRTYDLGGEKIHALDKVTLTVKEQEFVAIMGPSGSGKSTFLNLIGGLDHPDTGQVVVQGINLAQMKDKQVSRFRNKEIGFVFQSFHLQPMFSAEENVMLPLLFDKIKPSERKKRARKILETVGLGNRIKHRPSELSAGQRQRVSIARAIINQPTILLADEPTGNLDSKNGKLIMDLLHGLVKRQKMTIVMVTHDSDMAKMADKVITIRDGRVK
jgi:putative ABC transport system ATP-binding protein